MFVLETFLSVCTREPIIEGMRGSLCKHTDLVCRESHTLVNGRQRHFSKRAPCLRRSLS